MNKRQSTTLMVALASAIAVASPLSPEAALSRVRDHAIRKAPALHAVRLVHTGETPDGTSPAYYVFENDGGSGFLVVSADDRAVPLLAAVDGSRFDTSDMPPALKYWMDEYSRQIAFAISLPERMAVTGPKKMITSDKRVPIEPLCKTKWDQRSPYNMTLEKMDGRAPVTGCVATAMAQAMKVYDWPETGKGANSYTYRGVDYYMDFSEAPFRWDDMLDVYDRDATTAQNEAVAHLMKACGISTNMMYGRNSSGTVVTFVTGALYRNFDYAHCAVLHRDVYPDSQWRSIIYEELAAGRPVIYSGVHADNSGGHTFICDGYDADGLFHINWGWSGGYDGYYSLSALDPDGAGTGGGYGSYNYGQNAVVGIAPKGTPDLPDYYPFYATGGFMIDEAAITSRGIRRFYFEDGYMVCETGIRYVSSTMGVIVMKDGVRVTEWGGPTANFNALEFGGTYDAYEGYTVDEDLAGLEPGLYTLWPGVRLRNVGWYRIPVNNGANQCVYMEIDSEGKATYSNSGPLSQPDLEIEDIVIPVLIKSGEEFEMRFTVHNFGEAYSSPLYVVASCDGEESCMASIDCDFGPDSEVGVNVNLVFDGTPGLYEGVVVDRAGEAVSMPFRFELTGVGSVGEIVRGEDASVGTFDLSGRRVDADYKGIIVKKTISGARKSVK